MKLNEVTETGFYTGELDTEREIIFEVIENTDEDWLKEIPEHALLIDEWTYENTDEENRKHYEIYGGNLVAVVNAEHIDVVKITDTKYIISGKMGTHLMEDKPTRLEILQQQLKRKEQECRELKEENFAFEQLIKEYEKYGAIEEIVQQLNQLKAELEQEKALKETYLTCYKAKHKDIDGELFKLKQALTEIKFWVREFLRRTGQVLPIEIKQILQKISEIEVENAR